MLVLVLTHDQVVDTVALEVSLVDWDSPLASDLFPDSTFLVSVAVPWQSCLFRGHSPILVS